MSSNDAQSRRQFLGNAGRVAATAAALSALPMSIRRALAIPASSPTGTIADVEHVVILMQENRSFDHYFGAMHGVRGFGDRHTIPLPDGRTVWEQSEGRARSCRTGSTRPSATRSGCPSARTPGPTPRARGTTSA